MRKIIFLIALGILVFGTTLPVILISTLKEVLQAGIVVLNVRLFKSNSGLG